MQHEMPLHPTALVKWRTRVGAEKLALLLQETIALALREKQVSPKEIEQVNRRRDQRHFGRRRIKSSEASARFSFCDDFLALTARKESIWQQRPMESRLGCRVTPPNLPPVRRKPSRPACTVDFSGRTP